MVFDIIPEMDGKGKKFASLLDIFSLRIFIVCVFCKFFMVRGPEINVQSSCEILVVPMVFDIIPEVDGIGKIFATLLDIFSWPKSQSQ